MKTLESHLQYYLLDIKGYAEKYKDLKHQDGDKETEAIFRGKHEAYTLVASDIENIIKFHSKAKS